MDSKVVEVTKNLTKLQKKKSGLDQSRAKGREKDDVREQENAKQSKKNEEKKKVHILDDSLDDFTSSSDERNAPSVEKKKNAKKKQKKNGAEKKNEKNAEDQKKEEEDDVWKEESEMSYFPITNR